MIRVVILMAFAASVAQAQIQLPGVSKALSDKVMNNEILYTDAIDITRAMNGIDITQRGNNNGPMSAAGQRLLRQMMAERDQANVPAGPAVRGKAARAKAKAAERAKSKAEGAAALKEHGIDFAEHRIKPGDSPETIKTKFLNMHEAQLKMIKLTEPSIPVMVLSDLEKMSAHFVSLIKILEQTEPDNDEMKEISARTVKAYKDIHVKVRAEIAKRSAKPPKS